jgi:hypothetical protein
MSEDSLSLPEMLTILANNLDEEAETRMVLRFELISGQIVVEIWCARKRYWYARTDAVWICRSLKLVWLVCVGKRLS